MSIRVQFVVTDSEYDTLKNRASTKGISISQYVKDMVFAQDMAEEGKTSFDEIWNEFKEKLKLYPDNLEFNVATVMTYNRWKKLDKSSKISLARQFNTAIKTGKESQFKNIILVGRSSSNVSIYKKI